MDYCILEYEGKYVYHVVCTGYQGYELESLLKNVGIKEDKELYQH